MGQSGRFARTYRGREICFLDLAINAIQGQTSHQGPRAYQKLALVPDSILWIVARSTFSDG